MTERSLILVKPDGVRRGLIGDVLSRIEGKGLRIVAMDLRTLDRDTAELHYAEHSVRPFFGQLVDFITPRAHPRPRSCLAPDSGGP